MRVLIVDDDPTLANLADVLRAQGYSVRLLSEAAPTLPPVPPVSRAQVEAGIRADAHEAAERAHAGTCRYCGARRGLDVAAGRVVVVDALGVCLACRAVGRR